MEHLASALDGYADSVEGWGPSSASIMQQHQYSYGATSVSGGIATNLDERQSQAYGQWISFASADNAPISRLLAEFLAGLPHYDD
jgi:hypothetical protein